MINPAHLQILNSKLVILNSSHTINNMYAWGAILSQSLERTQRAWPINNSAQGRHPDSLMGPSTLLSIRSNNGQKHKSI